MNRQNLSVFGFVTIRLTKIAFLLLLLVSFVASYFLFVPIISLMNGFRSHCPFYLDFNTDLYSYANTSILLEPSSFNDSWLSASTCMKSFVVGVLILFNSIISVFMFIMFNRNSMKDQDKMLVKIWLAFSLIITVLVFVCACLLTNGYKVFCANLLKKLSQTLPFLNCMDVEFYGRDNLSNKPLNFMQHFNYSTYSAWVLFVVFLMIDFFLYARLKLEWKIKKFENESKTLSRSIPR
jgi:hypothetical protein